jgi:hypothetical protein
MRARLGYAPAGDLASNPIFLRVVFLSGIL